MGSNMAECHPVAFRWVMQAKRRGATLIHVDPRFTRTSAMADVHAPIRAGSDMVFLGGLIRHVLENDLFFREYVVAYTNASTIINPEFQDTEDLDGVFSGLIAYEGDPMNGFLAQYNNETWQYDRSPIGDQGRSASTAQSGEQTVESGEPNAEAQPTPRVRPLTRWSNRFASRTPAATRRWKTRTASSNCSSGTFPATPRRWWSASRAARKRPSCAWPRPW